jgi:hypothetical protein
LAEAAVSTPVAAVVAEVLVVAEGSTAAAALVAAACAPAVSVVDLVAAVCPLRVLAEAASVVAVLVQPLWEAPVSAQRQLDLARSAAVFAADR